MGMNYISVHSQPFSVQFAGEFWIFFIVTSVLLLFTLFVYWWYIRRNGENGGSDTENKFTLKGSYSYASSG